MRLEEKLRRTAEELEGAISGRRPELERVMRRRRFGGPLIALATAAAILIPAVVASLVILPNQTPPSGLAARPADDPAPATTALPTETIEVPEEGDGLSQLSELSKDWSSPFGEDASTLLAEDGVALVAYEAPGAMSETYETWADAEGDPFVLGVGGAIPETVVWVLNQPDTEPTVFGIVPTGTTSVELDVRGLPHITTDRVYQRPEVDRAVFVATVDEPTLGDGDGLVLGDGSGNKTTVKLQADEVAAESEPDNVISLQSFFVAQPLITGSTEVANLPEAIECQAPEGVTTPANRSGEGDGEILATPEGALEAFIAGFDEQPAIGSDGYHKLTAGGETIGFGVEFEGGSGYVTVVGVNRVDGGWTVTTWNASGC
jgi:hypothetical protein